MTDQPTYELIPLAQLDLAPENARAETQNLGDLDGLTAAIVEAGRLLTPLNAYREGDLVLVYDGGRRLRALRELDKPKKTKLPPLLRAGVPVLIDADKEAARLRSLATFVREGMDPVDEFFAYKALLDDGGDANSIARATRSTAQRVRQLLRLTAAAPEVLAALKAASIALDEAQAFTITDNLNRQREVLEAVLARPNQWSAWSIRSEIAKGSISGSDNLAVFVGVENYVAAGGAFLLDLFRNHNPGEADWADGDLARRLYGQKVEGMKADLIEEGWSFVELVSGWDYDKGYTRVRKADDDYSDDEKAASGVFLELKHNGTMEVMRGWRQTPKGKAAADAKAAPQADPARYGYGHGGHHKLTCVATEATRVALVRKPAAAFDALLTHLAWSTFRSGEGVSALNVGRRTRWLDVDGSDYYKEVKGRWNAVLPAGRVNFCDYIAGLPDAEKHELLAVCFGETLVAEEVRFDGHNKGRWSHLGWIAKHADTDVAAAWRPDAEFLKGGSKAALGLALTEMAPEAAIDATNAKKGVLVAQAADKAAAGSWTPKLLATLTDVVPERIADDGKPPIVVIDDDENGEARLRAVDDHEAAELDGDDGDSELDAHERGLESSDD